MWSLSLVMSECSLSGHGQGHESNFYVVDLENFTTASRRYRWYSQLVCGRFVYDTHNTMKATQSCRGWVHMFITHCPTLILQLHNLDLYMTCRTSSFCTVAWQMARFQLTRCSIWSLGDYWASCSSHRGCFYIGLSAITSEHASYRHLRPAACICTATGGSCNSVCAKCLLTGNWGYAFSALTLLVGRQEEEGHPACKNWVVGCWRGYLSGARCRFTYGPADATATHCLLLQ